MKLKQTEVFTITEKESDAWETVYGIFNEIRATAKTEELKVIAGNICYYLDEAADYFYEVEEEE